MPIIIWWMTKWECCVCICQMVWFCFRFWFLFTLQLWYISGSFSSGFPHRQISILADFLICENPGLYMPTPNKTWPKIRTKGQKRGKWLRQKYTLYFILTRFPPLHGTICARVVNFIQIWRCYDYIFLWKTFKNSSEAHRCTCFHDLLHCLIKEGDLNVKIHSLNLIRTITSCHVDHWSI